MRWPITPAWYLAKLLNRIELRPRSLKPIKRRIWLRQKLDTLDLPVLTPLYAYYHDSYRSRQPFIPEHLLEKDYLDPETDLGVVSLAKVEQQPGFHDALRKFTRLNILSIVFVDEAKLYQGWTRRDFELLGLALPISMRAQDLFESAQRSVDNVLDLARQSPLLHGAIADVLLLAPDAARDTLMRRAADMPRAERQGLMREIAAALDGPADSFTIRRMREELGSERRAAAARRAADLATARGDESLAQFIRTHHDSIAVDVSALDPATAVRSLQEGAKKALRVDEARRAAEDAISNLRAAKTEDERAQALRRLLPKAKGSSAEHALHAAAQRLAERGDSAALLSLRERVEAAAGGGDYAATLDAVAEDTTRMVARMYPVVQAQAHRAADVAKIVTGQFMAGFREGSQQRVEQASDVDSVPDESIARALAAGSAIEAASMGTSAKEAVAEAERRREVLRTLYMELAQLEAKDFDEDVQSVSGTGESAGQENSCRGDVSSGPGRKQINPDPARPVTVESLENTASSDWTEAHDAQLGLIVRQELTNIVTQHDENRLKRHERRWRWWRRVVGSSDAARPIPEMRQSLTGMILRFLIRRLDYEEEKIAQEQAARYNPAREGGVD